MRSGADRQLLRNSAATFQSRSDLLCWLAVSLRRGLCPRCLPIDESQRIQALYTVAFFRRQLHMDFRYTRLLKESYAKAEEPDVIYFEANRMECGSGFELLAILPPMIWLGRRMRRLAPR